MTSKKKQPEGIALLSMYNDDEDEEMEDVEEQEDQLQENFQDNELTNSEQDSRLNDSAAADEASAPLQHPLSPKHPRSRRGRLTIVDYGQDEVAMSPEPEDGDMDLQNANDNSIQGRTPIRIEPAQNLELDDANGCMEMEDAVLEENGNVGAEVDPLNKFLPPAPKSKCSEELQRKIDKFLGLKRIGKSFNAEVRNRKDYRNPDFLLHAVSYQDIDQIGSCFCKDVFDPHGYDSSDYYDEIEADMRREKERKDLESKRNQKVELFSGGMQPGLVASAPGPKPNIPITGAGGFHPVPTAIDAVARDSKQNRKSKWDKVDGDYRNSLSSMGQDGPAVGAHGSLLSAANAGAGYTAFVQQRRREAEERKSSERKFDRRS